MGLCVTQVIENNKSQPANYPNGIAENRRNETMYLCKWFLFENWIVNCHENEMTPVNDWYFIRVLSLKKRHFRSICLGDFNLL